MAYNENRWRNDQDRYGRSDDDRERWRSEGRDWRGGGRDADRGEMGRSEMGRGEMGRGDWGHSDWRRGDWGRDESMREDYRGGRGEGYGREGYGGQDYGYGQGRGFAGYDRDSGTRVRDYRRDYDQGRGQGRGEERGWLERAGDEVASWFGDDDAERRRRMDERRAGEHRGRGPRGYSRSDERIREDVSDRLTDDSYVDASDIDITVSNGEVTLSGHVDGRWAKRRAEDVAESVSGVRHVQNNLRVRQSGAAGTASGTSTAAGASAMAGMGSAGTTGTTEGERVTTDATMRGRN